MATIPFKREYHANSPDIPEINISDESSNKALKDIVVQISSGAYDPIKVIFCEDAAYANANARNEAKTIVVFVGNLIGFRDFKGDVKARYLYFSDDQNAIEKI